MADTNGDVLGPIDYLVVEFPGNQFNGQVLPALIDLMARGLVRVLDLAFVTKDADGNVGMGEVEDLDPAQSGTLGGIADFLADLVTDQDLEAIAADLPPNSSAAVLVWENTWASPFVAAVRGSGGEVVASGRLATATVLEALADASA